MIEYYKLTSRDTVDDLKSDIKTGLSTSEVQKRLDKKGYNIIPHKKKDSIFKIIINEIIQPITLLLIVAIISSFVVGEVVDALAIMFIVIVDLIIGVVEENKANTTAESLSSLVKVYAKVIRDSKKTEIESIFLVEGDIVCLESGDKVPADIRIIDSSNLTVDESTLTGESLSVTKNSNIIRKDSSISDRKNMLFASTNVVTGRCIGIVTSTGLDTEIGKIADKINNTKEEKSPLTIRVEKFSKQISALIVVVAVIITILLFSKGVSSHEIFLSVIALSVSAMPEGLPLALTMALTIASNKMSKKNVIAKKLYSIESLGSCTVIASDKTGTLTVNEQTAKKIVLPDNTEYLISGVGYDNKGSITGTNLEKAKYIAKLGAINNEAMYTDNKYVGDSIDIAFKVLAKKAKAEYDEKNIISSIPYESENKYSACFYKEKNKTYCTVKGSIEKVLSFCGKTNVSKVIAQNEALASDGYRVIAIAEGEVKEKDKYTEDDINKLTFVGLVAFIDPIRKEVVKSIKECTSAGIKVLMITGDHPLTACSIAKELKLVNSMDEVTTGDEVSKYLGMGDKEFDNFVKTKKVFSRVTPLQKLEIVESLKRMGEFVAVTGDGVNDAPALRSANIGVAMGSGTDVAKETAKMIVVDDNFTSIVASIKEGRIAYSNIRKITYFLISCGLAEILFFLLALAFDLPTPLVAIQLLWLNVVTDGIQDISLSFEQGEKDVMKDSPRDPKESLFDKELAKEILLSGTFIGLLIFGLFYYMINKLHVDLLIARGYTMALMVFIQNTHVFNCRSEKHSIFSKEVIFNPVVLVGVLGSVLLQIIVMEVPFLSRVLKVSQVPYPHMFILLLVALSVILVMELYKRIRFNKN